MNPQMQRWIATLAVCETDSKEAFAVWDEAEAAGCGDELESELGRLANVAGSIADAVQADYVMRHGALGVRMRINAPGGYARAWHRHMGNHARSHLSIADLDP